MAADGNQETPKPGDLWNLQLDLITRSVGKTPLSPLKGEKEPDPWLNLYSAAEGELKERNNNLSIKSHVG